MSHQSSHPSLHTATPSAVASPREREAFLLLRTVFTVAPIVFGLDKFFNLLTDWEKYLAPWVNGLVPGSARTAMLIVGVVEVVAGILVMLRPAIGGYVVAAWLAGIIVNLASLGGYWDVALRDFGLLVGALALARLAGPVRGAAASSPSSSSPSSGSAAARGAGE
ncbi:MAG TPA: hypothetical protein VFJ22_15520 [Dermatophilaceae bacterium]|jgi:uncharacterized membrane protein|nr:hypothetical protein [Dermatophilaceae bacterium]